MPVALLERIGPNVVTKTLDVRANKSVEAVADELKARAAGELLIDWWMQGNNEWRARPSGGMVLDLRHALLKAMGHGLRISPTGRWLGVNKEGHSTLKAGGVENAVTIGRDLLSWWEEPNGAHRLRLTVQGRAVNYDLRIGLNQSWRDFQVRKARSGAPGR